MSEGTKNKAAKATTADLENFLYEDIQCHKSQAREIVASVVRGIASALIKDGAIQISGLGVLRVKTRKARQGVNPKSGAKIQIAETTSVAFKNSATLRTAVATGVLPEKKAAAAVAVEAKA